MSMFAGVGVLVPLIEYFRPSKSPHLITALAGIAALVLSTQICADEPEKGLVLSFPFYVILPIITTLAGFSKVGNSEDIEKNKKQVEDQLKFSRAISISSAMICFVLAGQSLDFRGILFYLNYISCLIHMFIFLIYMAFRDTDREVNQQFNFFQFSFITTSYLVAAASCFVAAEKEEGIYVVAGLFFYTLWVLCEIFWTEKILSISKYAKKIRLRKLNLPRKIKLSYIKKTVVTALVLVASLYALNLFTGYRVHYYLVRFKNCLFYDTKFTSLHFPQTDHVAYSCELDVPWDGRIVKVEIANKLSFFPKTIFRIVEREFTPQAGPLKPKKGYDVVCDKDGRYMALILNGWFIDLYDFNTGKKDSFEFDLSNSYKQLEGEKLQALEKYHNTVFELINDDAKSLMRNKQLGKAR